MYCIVLLLSQYNYLTSICIQSVTTELHLFKVLKMSMLTDPLLYDKLIRCDRFSVPPDKDKHMSGEELPGEA